MHAAILEEFGRSVRVAPVELPSPRSGEVLVRVRAAGLCGTDLKLIDGQLGNGVTLPLVPGHEVAGEVVEDGFGFASGQLVACYVYEGCGACDWCSQGRPNLCEDAVRLGLERDGGLAEYVCVPGSSLIPLSSEVDLAAAAVAMDSVTTPWAALHGAGELQRDELVLLVGAGGLGLNAVQIALASGARVAVLDVAAQSRQRALELGAELAVHPDDHGAVVSWSERGVDLMVELSGVPAGFEVGLRCLRRGGRAVLCGYRTSAAFPLDSAAVVAGELRLRGSRNATPSQARAALCAVEDGRVIPAIARRLPLSQVQAGLDMLRAGGVGGRIVIEP